LKPEAYDEIKTMEEKRIEILEQKHENDIKNLKEYTANQIRQIMEIIQQNPKLSQIIKCLL
jgi:hypothetical protein